MNISKRSPRKHDYETIQNIPKKKDVGELKIQLIKKLVKTQTKPDPKKNLSKRNLAKSDRRASSALLRTFSNPKILLIENRQLVKGTKIFLHEP